MHGLVGGAASDDGAPLIRVIQVRICSDCVEDRRKKGVLEKVVITSTVKEIIPKKLNIDVQH